ncbi:hypothetical protein DFJ74DRAFT_701369 [Hyaloraphidium curvatum]|nr:hypothetical protein DFJ74DRAFT_701369 [Hyaloraphidium curvatum]
MSEWHDARVYTREQLIPGMAGLSAHSFALDEGPPVEVFWLNPGGHAASDRPQQTPVATPLKLHTPRSTMSRFINTPFKSPLASAAEHTPSRTVPAKRSAATSERRMSLGLAPKKAKGTEHADDALLELERRKQALNEELKQAKDRLRQLQLLSKPSNSPAVLDALTAKWKKATQEAALAYQAKCIESGTFSSGKPEAKSSFFDEPDRKTKAAQKPGFMGWPGWTGYGWAADDDTDESERASGEPEVKAEEASSQNVENPTSLKALLARLGCNAEQLRQLLDYVEEEDSFKP